MTRLICPFCGPRHLREFEFHKTVAAEGGSAFARVYERVDSAELSIEHWQHVGGCRGWLLVRRNPSTGAVTDCQLVGGGEPA
ncbi:MAG: sarcosine oxidase subunit delta [Proteobacteria bacterium]|nr:sarcosine oxidase subunit delta [Pseudomonadota bacterium]